MNGTWTKSAVLTLCFSTLLLSSLRAADQPRAAWQLPAGATEQKDIVYAHVSNQDQKLDLYMPAKVEGQKPRLVVWIHGGGWRGGDKSDCPLKWLVGKGYAVASINYRLSDVAIFPAQIHDCKGAIRWLRAHAEKLGYNADRIAVGGGSAGGHLVALLGTSGGVAELEGTTAGHTDQSSRVQGVIDYFGPTDFTKLIEQGHPEFTISLSALFLGTPLSSGKKQAELASPIYHITSDDAPVLIVQGTKDPLVYVPQSADFHDAYKKAGLESTLEIIEGGGHGGPPFFDAHRRGMIEQFLKKHILKD